MNKPRPAKLEGFTLVELLIAASIFSVIILSLYSALQTGILSYNKIDSSFAIYQDARILLSRMETELENSFAYSNLDSNFKGGESSLEFLSVLDLFEGSQSYTNVFRVKYELQGEALKRSAYQGLDVVKQNGESVIEELSGSVKEISFQYAYPTSNPNEPFDWQNEWPSSADPNQAKQLPLAVKIQLSLIEKNRHGKEAGIVKFSKIVALPLSGGQFVFVPSTGASPVAPLSAGGLPGE